MHDPSLSRREDFHTMMSMLLNFPVIASLVSSSVGGSTKFAVFSSADSKWSVPPFVTHGCAFAIFRLAEFLDDRRAYHSPEAHASLFVLRDLFPIVWTSSP